MCVVVSTTEMLSQAGNCFNRYNSKSKKQNGHVLKQIIIRMRHIISAKIRAFQRLRGTLVMRWA